MYDIVTFDKSRLHSTKPRSFVKEDLLQEIRGYEARDLTHIQAGVTEPRNWSLWAIRANHKLPADLQLQIQRAWAYPSLRHVQSPRRSYYTVIPDISEYRAKSSRYPSMMLADIRGFSRLRLRHVVPAVKQAPLEREGLANMGGRVDKEQLLREITNFAPTEFKKRNVVPQVKRGISGAEGRVKQDVEFMSWTENTPFTIDITTEVSKGASKNQDQKATSTQSGKENTATKVKVTQPRLILTGRSMPANWN